MHIMLWRPWMEYKAGLSLDNEAKLQDYLQSQVLMQAREGIETSRQ